MCGTDTFHAAYTAALSLEHWQIWRRLENRLTYPTAVRVNRADLSTLDVDRLTSEDIIAIAAAKGTGKTKLLSAAVSLSESVLSAGHRIALMRNLCERLKLDYRGDLDKVNGRFINGSGYALRIGFCVDALLAIDLSQFAGCDLILDEVVQVLRHLLTSSTCNKEGMRPLLLARFAELVRTARRVIVADADLDNATLHYLRQLRGGDAPVFLIRNDYQAAGYSVRFIESRDSSAAIAQLLADVGSLRSGKVLFVATDSKRTSASINRLIQQQYPGKRVLLLNSDTSGGEIEQAFIRTPDAELQNYDVVIASPSLATGVSIEAQGIVDRVYGIFSGGSSTDADMTQALGRVREPVDRVVWCAKRGTNFSKASRSTNPIELKSHLQQQTSVAASLVKLSLTDTTQSAIAAYDWTGDAHLNLYCHFAAEQNRSMLTLRDALLVRLRHEGHHVLIEKAEPDAAMKLLLRTAKEELRQFDAEAIAAAEDLTYIEVAALEKKESRSPDEELAIIKFRLKDDYCLDSLTLADILADKDGQRRAELLSLEAQLYPDVAIDRTARGLEKQAGWNSGNCPWDLSGAAVRQAIRSKLGLDDFLTVDREWTKYDIEPYAAKARQYAAEIKMVLHFTITPGMSDVQIIHQLLSQLGVKVGSRQSRAVPGHEGEKLRVYSLDVGTWEAAIEVLERRKARRDKLQRDLGDSVISGSPPHILSRNRGGEPSCTNSPNLDEWLTPESLADVRWMWGSAESEEVRAELQAFIPPDVLRRALTA
ncbi:hypothetical protein H6F67_24870 [Microcoleus sp. FACHB-1515]|uniref:plasmid replication protein, CyRepA1 family n=1 Tax=Cyanophyceae TaxID=3028117 RepID=UPI00168A0D5C|nr:plasmid replication protein, CyRepA1 family [Microcoleus sp. FACHB-1515]MBD2093083.1 hypothetical protein [Microcoleus sp. FACHB-1515]